MVCVAALDVYILVNIMHIGLAVVLHNKAYFGWSRFVGDVPNDQTTGTFRSRMSAGHVDVFSMVMGRMPQSIFPNNAGLADKRKHPKSVIFPLMTALIRVVIEFQM